MKLLKIFLLTAFLGYTLSFPLLSKEKQKVNNDIASADELKSIINNFASIDNKIDSMMLNINDKDISDTVIQIKKDIDKLNEKGSKILTSKEQSRADIKYFKMMNIYSNKINRKLVRIGKYLSKKNYRMAPVSDKNQNKGKDLLLINKNYSSMSSAIKSLSISSKKLTSTYKWLYISNR